MIQKAYDRGRNAVSYGGNNDLGTQLAKVARLIDGGLQTKVYTVYLGGFDTHAGQVGSNYQNGLQSELLETLSDAVATFQKDLTSLKLDDRVLGMTFSEFGRRIRSNDSRGTDHGTAGPMFLFGSCVNAGVVGDNVDLSVDIKQTDGVPMQFDFRDVYGSILVDWFKVPGYSVRTLLHDEFRYMPLASDCNEDSFANNPGLDDDSGWTLGNPYNDNNRIRIFVNSPNDARLRYSMFDTRGRLVLANEIGVSGEGNYLLFDRPARLPVGKYQLRLATDGGAVVTREVDIR